MAITIANITTKSGLKKYKAIVKKDGKIVKIKTFTRKTDARIWAKRIDADLELAEAMGCKGATMTFSDLSDEYISEWKGKDPNQLLRLAHWRGVLGDTKLVNITVDSIRLELKSIEHSQCRRGDGTGKTENLGRTRSPATINRYRSVLSSVLRYAVNEGYLTVNPVSKVPSKPLNNKIVRYLSDSERNRLLTSCKNATWTPLYMLVLLALTSGMRKGEIMNLRWCDIDFKRSVAMLKTTKNGEPRHCPIPQIALEELKKARGVGTSLIFPSTTNSDKPFEFKKHWAKALKEAGVNTFRFHDLRHSAASYLAMGGLSLFEIATILGHKDIKTTTRYAHLSTEHITKASEGVMRNVFNG